MQLLIRLSQLLGFYVLYQGIALFTVTVRGNGSMKKFGVFMVPASDMGLVGYGVLFIILGVSAVLLPIIIKKINYKNRVIGNLVVCTVAAILSFGIFAEITNTISNLR